MLRYTTDRARPGVVAFYDIRPGNGAGLLLQHRSLHGAIHVTVLKGKIWKWNYYTAAAGKFTEQTSMQIFCRLFHIATVIIIMIVAWWRHCPLHPPWLHHQSTTSQLNLSITQQCLLCRLFTLKLNDCKQSLHSNRNSSIYSSSA